MVCILGGRNRFFKSYLSQFGPLKCKVAIYSAMRYLNRLQNLVSFCNLYSKRMMGFLNSGMRDIFPLLERLLYIILHGKYLLKLIWYQYRDLQVGAGGLHTQISLHLTWNLGFLSSVPNFTLKFFRPVCLRQAEVQRYLAAYNRMHFDALISSAACNFDGWKNGGHFLWKCW